MSHTAIQAVWSGATGLPGYTRFRWAGDLDAGAAATAATAMAFFFTTIRAWIPAGVTISWDGLAQHYGTDGSLSGEVGYTPPANVVGQSTDPYAAASGAVVNWLTGMFVNGRRLRGRTFLVPLAGCFDTDGTLATGTASTIAGAATTCAASASGMVVFGGGGAGGYLTSPVSGVSVPDRAAVLRSRRD